MNATIAKNAPHPMDVALGGRLRLRRKAVGLTQGTLADTVGLTFQQIQKYERGFNRVSFSRLVEIAHALDCRVLDLITGLDGHDADERLGDEVSAVRVEGAADLLSAYVQATPALRRVILKLVREIARDCQGRHKLDGSLLAKLG